MAPDLVVAWHVASHMSILQVVIAGDSDAMGAMAAGQRRGAGALVRIMATATCCSAAASEQQEDRELPASVHSVFAHGAVAAVA